MPPVKYDLGLCAIAKNETPYLREWVAYHRLIGFERIFIYDNESDDIPVDETLRDLDGADMVETYRIESKGRQLIAYNHCLQKHGLECEWLVFLISMSSCCSVTARTPVFSSPATRTMPRLPLSVMLFGSNGRLGHGPGLVTERFTRSIDYSVDVKCIVKPALVALPISPHHFTYTAGAAVTAEGVPACLRGLCPLHPGQGGDQSLFRQVPAGI